MNEQLETHFKTVVQAIRDYEVVPFLGAGANLCGRPNGLTRRSDKRAFLPSGRELSEFLAERFQYPGYRAPMLQEARDRLREAVRTQDEELLSSSLELVRERLRGAMQARDEDLLLALLSQVGGTGIPDLTRVSEYAAIMRGTGPLYDKLRSRFDVDYPLTPLHELLASLPRTLREKGYRRERDDPRRHCFVIVTTNYDDLLERAFEKENQKFHVVWYMADGEHETKFFHRPADGRDPHPIENPNEYDEIKDDPERHPVILKFHGAVDRQEPANDSYVITEDHYIEYPIERALRELLPIPLATVLTNSSLLFLGYGLQDWNLRVILQRLWGRRKLTYSSWAVQLAPEELDRRFWRKKDVDIIDLPLERYASGLGEHITKLEPAGGTE